jgi:hypothetical protein
VRGAWRIPNWPIVIPIRYGDGVKRMGAINLRPYGFVTISSAIWYKMSGKLLLARDDYFCQLAWAGHCVGSYLNNVWSML